MWPLSSGSIFFLACFFFLTSCEPYSGEALKAAGYILQSVMKHWHGEDSVVHFSHTVSDIRKKKTHFLSAFCHETIQIHVARKCIHLHSSGEAGGILMKIQGKKGKTCQQKWNTSHCLMQTIIISMKQHRHAGIGDWCLWIPKLWNLMNSLTSQDMIPLNP